MVTTLLWMINLALCMMPETIIEEWVIKTQPMKSDYDVKGFVNYLFVLVLMTSHVWRCYNDLCLAVSACDFYSVNIIQSRRCLVVQALDSHARGCGFKSCLSQDKDYWWGKVTVAHLHKCAHSPGYCPLWLGNRLRSKSSMPHTQKNIILFYRSFVNENRKGLVIQY